jgi:hypothetical protein
MADDNNWTLSSLDDESWNSFFQDEIDRERWRTNFGNDSEAAEKAAYWRDMIQGIEPSVAAIYQKQGLNPYDVSDYAQGGIQDYKDVLSWHRVKATPDVASAFHQKGVNADAYEKWAKLGVSDPDTMIRFSEDLKLDLGQLEKFVQPLLKREDFQLNDLPQWLEAGIELREIKSWLEAGHRYPQFCKAWKALHMTPEDAKEWERVVVYPREAAKWIAAGYTNAKDVEGLRKQGYLDPEQIEAEAENVVMKGI